MPMLPKPPRTICSPAAKPHRRAMTRFQSASVRRCGRLSPVPSRTRCTFSLRHRIMSASPRRGPSFHRRRLARSRPRHPELACIERQRRLWSSQIESPLWPPSPRRFTALEWPIEFVSSSTRLGDGRHRQRETPLSGSAVARSAAGVGEIGGAEAPPYTRRQAQENQKGKKRAKRFERQWVAIRSAGVC